MQEKNEKIQKFFHKNWYTYQKKKWKATYTMYKNYILMHMDTPVFKCIFDDTYFIRITEMYNISHVPISCVKNNHILPKKINKWFLLRQIPTHRDNLSNLLTNKDTATFMLENLAISAFDTYWLKPEENKETWQEINPHKKIYFKKPKYTANATLNGKLEKYWIQNPFQTPYFTKISKPELIQQIYNEYIASILCKQLNINATTYTLKEESNSVVCFPNIQQNQDFISAYEIIQSQEIPQAGDDRNIKFYKTMLEKHNINSQEAINNMLLADIIMRNEDRHFSNFGIIRNANTNEWVAQAPLFDFGNSLWFDSKPNLEEVRNKMNNHMMSDDIKWIRNIASEKLDIIHDFPKLVEKTLSASKLPSEHIEITCIATYARTNMILNAIVGFEK